MTKKSTGRQNKDTAKKQAELRAAILAKQPKKIDPLEELRVTEMNKIVEQEAVAAEEKEAEGIWEELEQMYQTQLQVFFGYGMMAELMNQKHILAFIADSKAFIERVGMLKSDLTHQKKMLDQIHDMHAGRTSTAGVKAGGGTILAAAEIAEHYTGWGMGLISVVERNSTIIRSMVADAEKAYNAAQTKANEEAAALAAMAGDLVLTDESGEAVVNPDAPVVTEETPASIAAVVNAPAPSVSARGMTTSIYQVDELGFGSDVVQTGFAQVGDAVEQPATTVTSTAAE